MIPEKSYLKKIGLMDNEELARYWTSVQRWTTKDYPRLAALTDAWTETDIKIYSEGLLLITALKQARGFVQTEQRFSIQKRLDNLRGFMKEIQNYILRNHPDIHRIVEEAENGKKNKRTIAVIPPKPKADENGEPIPPTPTPIPEVAGRRPEHLSQYRHLLPVTLQQEAENIQGLYLQMASDRHKLELLAADPRSSQADRAYYAQQVARTEDRILNFWRRVDVAYEESQGRVVSPEVKQSLAKEARDLRSDGSHKDDRTPGSYTRDEIESMPDGPDKELYRTARIKRNRKYIQDNVTASATAKANANAKVRANAHDLLIQALSELHDWSIPISLVFKDRLRDQWDITIPDDWYDLTSEQKAERRKAKLSTDEAKAKASAKSKARYAKAKAAEAQSAEAQTQNVISSLVTIQ